jgi:hypothetical protein
MCTRILGYCNSSIASSRVTVFISLTWNKSSITVVLSSWKEWKIVDYGLPFNLEKKGTLVILPLLFNGDFAPLFLTLWLSSLDRGLHPSKNRIGSRENGAGEPWRCTTSCSELTRSGRKAYDGLLVSSPGAEHIGDKGEQCGKACLCRAMAVCVLWAITSVRGGGLQEQGGQNRTKLNHPLIVWFVCVSFRKQIGSKVWRKKKYESK